MSLKEDLPIISDEVTKASADRFTGKLQINLHMNQGGIGRINVVKDTDLKKNNLKEKKVWRTDSE